VNSPLAGRIQDECLHLSGVGWIGEPVGICAFFAPIAIDDLNATDFYDWTCKQEAALRAAAHAGGRSDTVDWERLAEEIEDVVNSEYFACRSFAPQILAHPMKLAWTQRSDPKLGWLAVIALLRAKWTPAGRKVCASDWPMIWSACM
jgi:hypothetical protein